MWKRLVILALLLAALAFGAQRFLSWRADVRDTERLIHARNLDRGGPFERVNAADYFLREDPKNEKLRILRAENLMLLSRHGDARQELRGLVEDQTPQMDRVVSMIVDSFFKEAESIIQRSDGSRYSSAIEDVTVLMDGVQSNKLLLPKVGNELRLALIDGRRIDALIRVNSIGLADRRVELAKAQVAGLAESIEKVGFEVADLDRKVESLGQELIVACNRVLTLDPGNALAMELLFHHELRRGQFDKARETALRIASLQTLSYEVAGRVAHEILELEASYGQELTEADINLVSQLIERPKLTGEPTTAAVICAISLALHRNDPNLAEQLALPYLKRDQLYSRIRVLWALANIQRGEPELAIKYLAKYSEGQNDARTLYALGLAYLAKGKNYNVTLGHEALLQCLESEPNFLPARLALIESRIQQGFTREAARDILIADRINPRHPRVKAAKAMLAVHTVDFQALASLLDMEIKDESSVTGDMVSLAASMALDDVDRVRIQLERLGELNPDHVLVLVARAWCDQDPMVRPKVASALIRSMIRAVEANPMLRARPGDVPRYASLTAGPRGVNDDMADVVREMRLSLFQPRLLECALRLVDSGLDHWPQDDGLIRTAAELNLWLEQPEAAKARLAQRRPGLAQGKSTLDHAIEAWASADWPRVADLLATEPIDGKPGAPTLRRLDLALAMQRQDPKAITDALTRLLAAHPWAEEPLLSAVADALLHGQADRAYAMIGVAEVTNPKVAHLARGRMNLGLNRASEAFQSTELIVGDENLDSEVRRWAAEIRARAQIVLQQDAMAAGMFDQLSLSARAHRLELKMKSADVYLMLGKKYAAAELISELLAEPDLTPWLRDQLLARALLVMSPQRVRASVEAVLSLNAQDSLLLVYRALVVAEEDAFSAESMLESILARKPGSPRALYVMAEVVRRFQPDHSRRIYLKLSEYPGSVGQAARQALKEMDQPTATQSPGSTLDPEEGSLP